MAPEPKLILTDRPSDTTQAVIDGGLAQSNEEQAGYRDWRDLAVLVTDPDDAVRGGLLAGPLWVCTSSTSFTCRQRSGVFLIAAATVSSAAIQVSQELPSTARQPRTP